MIGSLTIVCVAAIFVGGLLVRALGGAASSILADEFKASAPETAQKIIRFAAGRIPEHARKDMLETWLAEASAYEGRPLKALRFALVNCLAAAPSVARQLRPALAPADDGTNEAKSRRQIRARRSGSDLIRREVHSAKEFFRLANRSWRDSLRVASVSLGASASLLLGVVREVARVVQGLIAPIVGLVHGTVDLLGSYDYSREWRSVLQLLALIVQQAPKG